MQHPWLLKVTHSLLRSASAAGNLVVCSAGDEKKDVMAIESGRRFLLVDPTTQPIIAEFTGVPRLREFLNKRVGLIDDSKPNARELREEITFLLGERFGVDNVKYHSKPLASKPAAPDAIWEIAEVYLRDHSGGRLRLM